MGDNPSKYTKIILKGYEMILKNHNIAEINKLSAPMVKIMNFQIGCDKSGKNKKKLSFSSALVNKTVDKTTLSTCFIFSQKIFNILKEHIVFSTHYTKQGKKNSGEEVVSIRSVEDSFKVCTVFDCVRCTLNSVVIGSSIFQLKCTIQAEN
jgi:uncharacterized membrane protein YbjE (DUF340 family)